MEKEKCYLITRPVSLAFCEGNPGDSTCSADPCPTGTSDICNGNPTRTDGAHMCSCS